MFQNIDCEPLTSKDKNKILSVFKKRNIPIESIRDYKNQDKNYDYFYEFWVEVGDTNSEGDRMSSEYLEYYLEGDLDLMCAISYPKIRYDIDPGRSDYNRTYIFYYEQ